MLHRNRYGISLAAFLFAALSAGQAYAQDENSVMNEATVNPTLYDRVQFRVGPFFTRWQTTVVVEEKEFVLDDRLGESDTVLSIGGFARITNRIRFNFNYWGSSREDTELLTAPTPVGGITLPPGTQFYQDYETATIRGGLGWAFVSNDQVEFGVDVGASLIKIKNNLTGRLPSSPPLDIVSIDETEPMGTVGLFFQYAFSPRWSFAARAGALGFDIGNIEGEIYSAEGRVEYRPFKNIGLGVAYSWDDADVILKDDLTPRNITYTTQGVFAYLSFGFGSIR